jgi:energy-coupling factor transporter ATP-binding protein EcfA2
MTNFYGIKELLKPDLISGNTIIYAPNAVMKTSFSDGLRDIAKGITPKDIFTCPETPSNFELDEDGKIITKATPNCLNLVTINYGNNVSDIFNDPSLMSLVMSPSLKAKYKTVIDRIEQIKESVNQWISSEVLGEKKTTENGWAVLKSINNSQNEIGVVTNIPELSSYESDYYSGLPFLTIFNNETEKLFVNPDFSSECKSYSNSVKKELDKKVFSSGFTMSELIKVRDELKKNHFFEANHKIHLNSLEEMGAEELDEYIKTTTDSVYSSQEVLIEFEKAKKVLEKSKTSRALKDLLMNDKVLLSEIANPNELKRKVVYSILFKHSPEIEKLKTELKTLSTDLKTVIEEANKSNETWNKVLNDYNNRFVSNKLDVSIENQAEAVLGLSQARFVKRIKGTNQQATHDMMLRFSSGEKRALGILNIMFEVELKGNQKFTLLLDDVSDSFDYKNKYAILECLKDFSKKSNIQLIILTHNFDFYRSCKNLLSSSLQSKLFAYKDKGNVSLIEANQDFFDDYSYFNNWKNSGKYSDYLALIPFARNLAQLEGNSKTKEYLELTKYLHYSGDLETIDFSYFGSFIQLHNGSVIDALTANYWATLNNQVRNILSNQLVETDLRSKVILGLYMRLSCDRFMWKKYSKLHSIDPTITVGFNQSRELFDLVVKDLEQNELSIVQTSMTIAPSFIHLNSFMYEPLIDVGG